MNQVVKISVVSPIYKGEKLVEPLVSRLCTALERLDVQFEIILVEDGSPDLSWAEIQKSSEKDSRIIGVKLSRNFGQHAAISAGLNLAKGEWVVVMDGDLQDQPEEIGQLYKKALEGFDIVWARRTNRQDAWFKVAASALFYRLLNYLTDANIDPATANFGIYHHKVIAAINGLQEQHRIFRILMGWVGFRSAMIDVVHAKRLSGESTYSLSRLFHLALDISLSNSQKPLRLVVKTGFVVAFLGFLFALYEVYLVLYDNHPVLGYGSIIVSIWILSGLIISIIGVVGLYVGKIFDGVKNRPPYIVDQISSRPKSSP